uniref:Putative conserved plasma membrane protein n=1 Tax=Culex tarsalis TaxID=7177 RepID=A0A1Q3F508_CULTA
MSTDSDVMSLLFDDQVPSKDKHYEFGFALPSPTPNVVQPMDVDSSGGPLQLQSPAKQAEPGPGEHPGEKRQRLNDGQVKRKIRKLMAEESGQGHQSGGVIVGESRFRQLIGLRLLLVCTSAVVMAVCIGMLTDDNVRKDFYKRYKRQYELLLYGAEDYCSQQLDFSNVTRALEAQLVGQRDAIEHVSRIFYENRHQLYSSLALLGPVGVGKSLMAKIVAENFQWRSNVHRFTLSVSPSPDQQYIRFQQFLQSIRSAPLEPRCGDNLLIVDFLDSQDIPMVNKMDQRIALVASKDATRITTIFVFQGTLSQDNPSLRILNGTIEKVLLRQLDEGDLERCVRQEAAGLGYSVEERLLRTVMDSMDVQRSGCKAVLAKLGFYWQQEQQQQNLN